MHRVTLQINGMTCAHCVAAVKDALSTMVGVNIEDVGIGHAIISYDPGKTTSSDITDAIADAGYEAYATP